MKRSADEDPPKSLSEKVEKISTEAGLESETEFIDAVKKRSDAVFQRLAEKTDLILKETKSDTIGNDRWELLRLVHELEVYRIELELKNEDLCRTQKELEKSRAQYFKLYDSVPVGLLSVSAKGLISRHNRAIAEILAEPGDDLTGSSFSQFIHPRDHKRYFSCLSRLAELEDRHFCEVRLTTKSGGGICVRIGAGADFDDEGNMVGWRLTLTDITTQVMAEENVREAALTESEKRFRAFVTAGWDVVYSMSPDWSEMRKLWDPNFIFDSNQPGSAWLKKQIHPEDRPHVLAVINEAIKNKRVYEMEHRVLRLDGSVGWTSSRAIPYLDESGEVLEWIGAAKDITHQRQVEEALRESEARYRTLFESIDEGFCIIEMLFDKSGKPVDYRFLQTNPAFEIQTGLKDAIGRRMRELRPSTEQNWFETYGRIARTGEPERFTEQAKHLNNRWYDVYAFRIGPAEERKVAVLFTDITARVQAERTLKRFNERLEQQVAERTKLAEDRAKQLRALVSELTITEQRERRRLADVLHDELQQLLVGVKINSEVLSTKIEAENRKITENIQNLIDQSIQVSRSLTAQLSPPILQMGSLFAALKWLSRWIEETYGLAVDLEGDPALDPNREDIMLFLFQSVRELLLNVVKHAGTMSAHVEMSQDAKGRLSIAVTDKGVGFNPDTVWEKATEGTGFGLFSVKERLKMLGGKLEIESAPGKGASFTLYVPSKTKRKDYKNAIQRVFQGFFPSRTQDTIQVLLVDDHTVVRQGLSIMLSEYPEIEIVGQAANGEAAVRMAKKLQPDVILMDITMPKMDGIEATRIIHSEFPYIRIIGLSVHEKQDQAARIIEAGASTYCTKDGDTADLLSAIRGGVSEAC